jgi:hypothetical protein
VGIGRNIRDYEILIWKEHVPIVHVSDGKMTSEMGLMEVAEGFLRSYGSKKTVFVWNIDLYFHQRK